MSEKWIYWKIPGIKDENYYYIKMLVDGANGLEIFMEDASLDEENLVGTVKINFGFVESYRFCDEHCRLDLWNELSQKHEKSFSQIALSWIRAKKEITAPIIGTRTMEQLDDNLGCIGWDLTEEEVKVLDEVSHIEEPYPYRFIKEFGW